MLGGMGWLGVFRSRRMAILFVLGFSSGLPLYLTGNTLQAWLSSVGADLGQIATLSAIGLAYTLKFLWAPVFDWIALPFLGRRRGWLLALQLALVAAIAAMGLVDPIGAGGLFAALALAVAFLSASQDIVIDAYKADVLSPGERAAGASAYVIGYRTAMLGTGALALVMADHVAWPAIYATMAAIGLVGIAGTLLAPEPPGPPGPPGPPRPPRGPSPGPPPRRAARALAVLGLPIGELWRRLGPRGFAIAVGFTALYKFGDYFAQTLIIAFLRSGAGFEFTEIAAIYQGLGYASTVIGGLGAGALTARLGMRGVLIGFGLLQAATNLLYAWLALAGASTPIFCAAVLCDGIANAMGTAAFVAYLMSVCSPAMSATQLALLTSLSSVGQRVFGAAFAGGLVAALGWSGFFAATSAMALPGLWLAHAAARQEFAPPRRDP
jgi:PAT family beta-lactamase induction signal transducer AmpG